MYFRPIATVALMTWLWPLILRLSLSEAGTSNLELPNNSRCACVGDILSYKCTAVGGGATLWGGTAFNCPTNEIILRHSQFSSPEGTTRECNNGAIIGKSTGAENNCYTSQLNVTVSGSLNNKTVMCVHNLDTGQLNTIGGGLITLVSAPQPHLVLDDTSNGSWLKFNWTIELPPCYFPIFYDIYSINCGTCPNTTNQTTATCLDLQLSTSAILCTFTVESVVCGNIRSPNSTVLVRVQVPDVPYAKILPRYSNKQGLVKVKITINQTIISDETIKWYNASFSTSTSGSVIDSSVIQSSAPCADDICDYVVNLPFPCSQSSTINITISASNRFGNGPQSDPMTLDCTNTFVNVEYNTVNSTFTCLFLNSLDTSEKICSIRYGQCGQETKSVSRHSINSSISLSLNPMLRALDCYIVTASNDTFTAIVEGRIAELNKGNVNNIIAISIGIVIPVVIIFSIIIAVGMIIVIVIKRKTLPKKHNDNFVLTKRYEDISNINKSIEDALDLSKIATNLEILEVEADSELKEFVCSKPNHSFTRGCAFYEFKHEVESISEDKRLILMKKNTDTPEFYSPQVGSDILHKVELVGESVQRPEFEHFRVFVQSTGSGVRHLPHGSSLLYEKEKKSQKSIRRPPLYRIYAQHFVRETLGSGILLEEFCKKHGLDVGKRLNVFLNLKNCKQDVQRTFRDVILIDEKGNYYSGDFARKMVHQGIQQVDQGKWSVFVLSNFTKKLYLGANTELLYQDPVSRSCKYFLVQVDEESAQLSEFVKKKLKIKKCENGRAFYQFTRDREDLLHYKEVVRVEANKLKTTDTSKEAQIFESKIEYFYDLEGAPGVEIRRPKQSDIVIFVQSTSQGSRCLKKGTFLLYKER